MVFRELEYVISSGASVDTGIMLGNNYKVEVDYCYLSGRSDYTYVSTLLGDTEGGIRVYERNGNVQFSYGGGGFGYSPNKLDGSFVLENRTLTVNGEIVGTKSGNRYTPSWNMYFFTLPSESARQVKRPTKLGKTRFYNPDNELIGEFIPAIDEHQVVCFYDNVNSVFRYANGELFAGPFTHNFQADISKLDFTNTGGTSIITVTADADWSCTKPSWVGMSQTTGTTGETQITIYAPKAFTSRSAVLTFVDSDEYEFTISIVQKGDETIIPICRVKKEGECVNKLFHNGSVVKKLYRGDDLLFRALGVKPYLILSETQLGLNITGETQTVTVASSNPYTATTTSDWITLEQNGQTLSITAPAAQSDRNGTITVSTTNGYFSINETISVSQKNVEFVDYVYVDARDNVNTYIDTGIYPTTATTFRIKYKTIEANGGCIVGFGPTETPIHSSSDNNDYRYFNHLGAQSCTWDFNSSRLNPSNFITEQNNVADVTVGNNYVTNNYTNNTQTGSTQSSIASPDIPIYLNLTNRSRIQSLEIYEGQTLVFNGHAALKDGVYGIWDSVTSTLLQPYQQVYTVLGGNFS